MKDLAKRAEYDYFGTISETAEKADSEPYQAQKTNESAAEQMAVSKTVQTQKHGWRFVGGKIVLLIFMLSYGLFLYVHRDPQDPKNLLKLLAESSTTVARFSEGIGHRYKRYDGYKFQNSEFQQKLIFYAVRQNKLFLADMMLNYMSPNLIAAKKYHRSLLMLAEKPEMIELLLQSGADVDYRDDLGETALTLAVRRNDVLAAELLLQAGANAQYVLPNGKKIMQLASEQNNTVMMAVLQSYGATE